VVVPRVDPEEIVVGRIVGDRADVRIRRRQLRNASGHPCGRVYVQKEADGHIVARHRLVWGVRRRRGRGVVGGQSVNHPTNAPQSPSTVEIQSRYPIEGKRRLSVVLERGDLCAAAIGVHPHQNRGVVVRHPAPGAEVDIVRDGVVIVGRGVGVAGQRRELGLPGVGRRAYHRSRRLASQTAENIHVVADARNIGEIPCLGIDANDFYGAHAGDRVPQLDPHHVPVERPLSIASPIDQPRGVERIVDGQGCQQDPWLEHLEVQARMVAALSRCLLVSPSHLFSLSRSRARRAWLRPVSKRQPLGGPSQHDRRRPSPPGPRC